jgi:hypothetical protein
MRDSTGSPKDVMAHDNTLADESKGADYPDVPAQYISAMHDIPDEQALSAAAILKGSVANRMNLFEKKVALINA